MAASHWKVERLENGAVRAEGFFLKPVRDFVYVLDYGQPNMTPGGLVLPNDPNKHSRYFSQEWRVGEVVAVGPGEFNKKGTKRLPPPDVKIGDVVLFSRKHGSRLGSGYRMKHPKYGGDYGLLIRILDTQKCQAVLDDFEPWWDVEEASRALAEGIMTG